MDPMTLLVFWIAAALLSYAVARKKGRDSIAAAAFGLLFGYFALLYYLLSHGSNEYELKQNHRKTIKANETKRGFLNNIPIIPGILIIITGVILIFMGAIWYGGSTSPDSSTFIESTTKAKSNQYPSSVRNNFMESCTAEGSPKEFCSCSLKYLESKYSLGEYAGIESEIAKTGKLPQSMADAISACSYTLK